MKKATVQETNENARTLSEQILDVSLAAKSASGTDGVILYANQAFLDTWGYDANEEAIGNPISHFFAEPEEAVRVLESLASFGKWDGEFQARKKDGSTFIARGLATVLRNNKGEIIGYQSSCIDVTAQRNAENELRISEERLKAAQRIAQVGYIDFDATTGEMIWSDEIYRMHGIDPEQPASLELLLQHSHPEDLSLMKKVFVSSLQNGSSLEFEIRLVRSDGEVRHVLTKIEVSKDKNGEPVHMLGTMLDITNFRNIEIELGHARKMKAVGQLAAGIAHEINTPTQFVNDSVHFLKEAFENIHTLLGKYQEAVAGLEKGGMHHNLLQEIQEAEEDADLTYLNENVPEAFNRCLDGLSRISTIVRAMKEFAHPDKREKSPGDINKALQTTLAIAKNEYKYVADVETELQELPMVFCYLGDLSQVFLNLIVNAAHAIEDVVCNSDKRGKIFIRTAHEGDSVRIEIQDTGKGIPKSVRERIFEPFFTTKDVGKGSGQGLAIAHSIINKKHQGSLTVDSCEGNGTTFIIRIPIDLGKPVE